MTVSIVHFTTDTTRVEVTMTENNAATQDFLSKLPMTVTFEDFHGKEKIAFPDERIDATGAPGMAAEIGDFFCYAPWGNFGFFYEPLAFSDDNIRMGRTDNIEGVQALDGQRVTISSAD